MSVGTYSLAREGDKLLSPHFRVREFACRDGADLVKIDTDLVELLERISPYFLGRAQVFSVIVVEAIVFLTLIAMAFRRQEI